MCCFGSQMLDLRWSRTPSHLMQTLPSCPNYTCQDTLQTKVVDSQLIISPVRPTYLHVFLHSAPKAFLTSGFTYGFHIPHIPISLPLIMRNHVSAYQNSAFLESCIQAELQAHHISGPFSSPPHPQFIFSPLGVILKSWVAFM